MMRLVLCGFLLMLAGSAVHASKDPADVVISAFCGDLELIYPRSDACLACTQKLASLVFMLYRNRDTGFLTAAGGPSSASRLMLKRPSPAQKLEDDEIKRNSIDALHGLTLG